MGDLILSPTTTPSDDAALVDWLSIRDAPCPLCGYNLRGLASPRCPECGHSLGLSVSLVEPFLKAWVALVGSACAGGGVGLVFLALVARLGWPDSGIKIGANLSILIFIGMIPVAVTSLYFRR